MANGLVGDYCKAGAEFQLSLKCRKIHANICGQTSLAQNARSYACVATAWRKDQRALGERIDRLAHEPLSIFGILVPTYSGTPRSTPWKLSIGGPILNPD